MRQVSTVHRVQSHKDLKENIVSLGNTAPLAAVSHLNAWLAHIREWHTRPAVLHVQQATTV